MRIIDKFKDILNIQNKHKKLLVHLHIYYYDQTDYFISKLKNIVDCDWDLYITVVERNEEELNKFKKLKPNLHIICTKNIGYDIYPFLYIIQNINLEQYDYVLKMHTKRFLNRGMCLGDKLYVCGYIWRNDLIDALIKNKKTFKNNLKKMSKTNYGLVCNKNYLLPINGSYSLKEDLNNLKNLETELSVTSKYDYFVAGTIFLIRADVISRLKTLNLLKDDFEKGTSGKSGLLAHAVERLFAILTEDCGYKILTVATRPLMQYRLLRILRYMKTILYIHFS